MSALLLTMLADALAMSAVFVPTALVRVTMSPSLLTMLAELEATPAVLDAMSF